MELMEDGDGVECLHLEKLGGAKIEASPQNPDHDFSAATSLRVINDQGSRKIFVLRDPLSTTGRTAAPSTF
jgi:hypothetical protein